MITKYYSLILVAAALAAFVTPLPRCLAQEKAKAIELFDGKSLEGWTAVSSVETTKPEDVWSVKDGILVCQGKPSGYVRTKRDDFENYVLELDWRFPAGSKGGNSGVLLHTSTPKAIGVWPKSLEAQLAHMNAGDIWVIGETCEIENSDKRVMGRRHYNLTDDSEKPIGEWNHYEVKCEGDTITLKVNGDLVNHATKCSTTKGAICLQSEGTEIHFRNIRLTPLVK